VSGWASVACYTLTPARGVVQRGHKRGQLSSTVARCAHASAHAARVAHHQHLTRLVQLELVVVIHPRSNMT